MVLIYSARLQKQRPSFDSLPGHVSLGTSSLGRRWPWSSLFIEVTPTWFKNTWTCKCLIFMLRHLQVLFGLKPSTAYLLAYIRASSPGIIPCVMSTCTAWGSHVEVPNKKLVSCLNGFFSRVFASHHVGLSLIPGRDMSVLGPRRWPWSNLFIINLYKFLHF